MKFILICSCWTYTMREHHICHAQNKTSEMQNEAMDNLFSGLKQVIKYVQATQSQERSSNKSYWRCHWVQAYKFSTCTPLTPNRATSLIFLCWIINFGNCIFKPLYLNFTASCLRSLPLYLNFTVPCLRFPMVEVSLPSSALLLRYHCHRVLFSWGITAIECSLVEVSTPVKQMER